MRLSTASAAAAAALLALSAGACASIPGMGGERAESAPPTQFARIQPGTSLRGDVMAVAGEPDYVVPRHNLAVYVDGPRPGGRSVGCGLDYRFLCGIKRKDAYDVYVIQYNENDTVKRAEGMPGDMSYAELVAWASSAASASAR